jgi:hypothetical protein
LTREESLVKLARRFFRSRGPATVYDMAKWSGLTVSDARQGLAALETSLSHVDVDGRTHWYDDSALRQDPAAPDAHLLSVYDEYVSGYKDRSAIGDARVGAALQEMGNALRFIVIVHGRVVGTWRLSLKRNSVVIEINPLTEWTIADHRAVRAAASRYGALR